MSHSGLHILRPDEAPDDGTEDADATSAPAVLLVEDDPAIVRPLAEALQDAGLEVATAGNGRDALGLLRSGLRPSAIVLDLMMPVMDGWDFRHEQVADPALKDIPVVIITATGFSPETIRAQFGNVDLLAKPIASPTLLAIIGRLREQAVSAA